MKNAIRKVARWTFVSAPGVGVLVISIGLGAGYAATKGGSGDTGGPDGPPGAGVGMAIPGGGDLSDADRQALEKFHECMRGKVEPPEITPGERPDPEDLPDPEKMREQIDSAYDQCEGELTDELRQQFEQQDKQRQEFESCLEDQGVTPPEEGGDPPREQDREAMEKAFEACKNKLPDQGGVCIGFGPGPGPGLPGGPGFGPPGAGASAIPAPPPGASSDAETSTG